MSKMTDSFKKMSLLSKNTVVLLSSAFVLCFVGGFLSFFSPSVKDSFSGFPQFLNFIWSAVAFILRFAALFLLISSVFSGSKSSIAFAAFMNVIVACVDLLAARPIINAVTGLSLSQLSSEFYLIYVCRLIITALTAALAAMLIGGFRKKTVAAGYVIFAVMLITVIPIFNVWAIQIRESVSLMFNGNKSGAAVTAVSAVLNVIGYTLEAVGLSFIGLHTARVAKKKKRA